MGFHRGHWARLAAVLVLVISISTVSRAQGVVRGVLYDDATGSPIRGTVMLIDPHSDAAAAYTPTDSVGGFLLQVREGVYQISAVRPGYKSVLSAPVPLKNGERLTIRVPIAANGDPEHRIGVTEHVRPTQSSADMRDAALTGFEQRRASGAGLHYDRTQLTRHGEETLGQFLMNVPGLTVPDPSGMSSVQMSRNASTPSSVSYMGSLVPCHVGWFVDGQRVDLPGRSDPLTDGLGSLRIDVIDAVEVFRGISEMPAQFAAPDLRCGAIAVWMRKD